MRLVWKTLLVATLAIGLLAPLASNSAEERQTAPAMLEDVRVTVEGNSTIVRVKTSTPRRYRASLAGTPDRLVLDFEDTIYAWRNTPMVGAVGAVVQIRGGQYKSDVARVVLDLTSQVPYSVHEDGNSVIVVLGESREVYARRTPSTAPPVTSAPSTEPARERVSPAAPSPTRTADAQTAPAPPIPPLVGPATEPTPPAPTAGPAQGMPTRPLSPPVEPMTEPTGPPAPAARPAQGAPPPLPSPVGPTTEPTSPRAPIATPARPAPVPAESRLISLEFKDADVVNLLRILAVESGRNIVVGDDVKGKMSISLRNVPWTLALQTILETRGLQRIDRDGVMRIVSTEQLTKEREATARMEEAKVKAEVDIRTKRAEAELKEREAQLKEQDIERRKREQAAAAAEAIARGPLTEVAIRLAYADPGEVANTLQGLLALGTTEIPLCRKFRQEAGKREVTYGTGGGVSEGPVRGPIAEPPFSQLYGPPREEGRVPAAPPPPEDVSSRRRGVQAYCPTNTLFLRLHAADLERIRRLIRDSLDLPAPQVKIEARMEILDRNALFAIGVQWGGGGVLAANNKGILVGRGFTSDPANAPSGGIAPSGVTSPNPNLTLQNGIPVSAQTGLPLGGNLVNLPIGSLLNNAALAGAGGLALGLITKGFNIDLALEALRTQGKSFSIARPDIVTLENNLARIKLGEEIPYATVSSAGTQVQFKEAILELSVIPMVIRKPQRNQIKMSVIVTNNSRGNVVNLGTSGAPPAINKRSAETDVIINEGDHLVIGGITIGLSEEEIRKIPALGDIPIFGWLFKQRGTRETRSELVVFITPTVLAADSRPSPTPQPSTQPPAK